MSVLRFIFALGLVVLGVASCNSKQPTDNSPGDNNPSKVVQLLPSLVSKNGAVPSVDSLEVKLFASDNSEQFSKVVPYLGWVTALPAVSRGKVISMQVRGLHMNPDHSVAEWFRAAASTFSANSTTDTVAFALEVKLGDTIPPVLSRQPISAKDSVNIDYKDSLQTYGWTQSPQGSSLEPLWKVEWNGVSKSVKGDTLLAGRPFWRNTVTLPVGLHLDSLVVRDSSGNRTVSFWRHLRLPKPADTLAPVVSLESPGQDSTVLQSQETTYSAMWHVSDENLKEVRLDNLPIKPIDTANNGALRFILLDRPIDPGSTVRHILVAEDQGGRTTRSRVVFVRPVTALAKDTLAPVLTRLPPFGPGNRLDTLPAGQTGVDVAWQVVDTSLKSVLLDGLSTTGTGDIFRKRVELLPGESRQVYLYAEDRFGNKAFDTLGVVRLAVLPPGDTTTQPPRVSLLLPVIKTGTVVPFDSTTILARWSIVDTKGIDDSAVHISGLPGVREGDSVWSARVPLPPTGASTVVTLQVRNRSGKTAADFFTITRLRDLEKPTVIRRNDPGTVPFDSTSLLASWLISDNHKLGKVRIQGLEVAGTNGLYSSRMPLELGSNKILLLASDSSGNEVIDSIVVTRLNDTLKAVVFSDTVSRLRAGSFALHLTNPNPNAQIRYTLDGSDPTESSLLYKDSIWIDTSKTIKARAFAFPRVPGPIVVQSYRAALPVAVSGSGDVTLVLMSDASLWGFGLNDRNTLGLTLPSTVTRPVKVADSVRQFAAGGGGTLFWIKLDGTLWGVGTNDSGELACGTYEFQPTPILITREVKAVASGGPGSTLFLKTDGSLWASGSNSYGELGIGTRTKVNLPVQVASGVARIGGIGTARAHFLKLDGTYWSMGAPYEGELGVPGDSIRTLPAKVSDSVELIGETILSNFFRKWDGTFWAFGWNSGLGGGKLGLNDQNDRYLPVPHPFAGTVKMVADGAYHSLILSEDGSLFGMGSNENMQLGAGVANLQIIPTLIASNVEMMAASYWQSYYITRDGRLFGTGRNENAQIGIGNQDLTIPFTRIRF